MWIKTVDDEVINLDNMEVIRAAFIRQYKYTVVEAVSVNTGQVSVGTGQVYFLWQHDGEAVEMAKEWIDEHILKITR